MRSAGMPVNDITTSLSLVLPRLKDMQSPAQWSFIKTWLNGWTTSCRMHEDTLHRCLFGCGSDNLGVETVLQVRLEAASDCQPTSCHLILEGPAQRPWGLHLEAKDPEKSRPEQWMVCGGVAE